MGKYSSWEHFEDYVEDVAHLFQWICREHSDLPLFLFGHSLGGAIALHFAAGYERALAGLILSAPAYKVGQGVSGLKIAIGKVLSSMTPTLRIPHSADSSALSRDLGIVEEYRKDILCCHFNTVRQGNEILRALDSVLDKARLIHVPTVIFHGSVDRVIRAEGSFEILKNLASHDKTLHLIPGGFHEPHNDFDKEKYFDLLNHWVKRHLQ